MAKREPKEQKQAKPAPVTSAIIRAGLSIARQTSAKALFVFGDVRVNLASLRKAEHPHKVVLVSAYPELVARGREMFGNAIQLPSSNLSRIGQFTVSIIMAISGKIINPRDKIVFLSGTAERAPSTCSRSSTWNRSSPSSRRPKWPSSPTRWITRSSTS